MDEAKVGVFLSDCGNQLSKILDFNALTDYVEKFQAWFSSREAVSSGGAKDYKQSYMLLKVEK